MGLSPTTAQHVREAFGDAVEVIDGGPTDVGIESTVVTWIAGKLTLLRPGMISLGDIAQTSVAHGAHPSPGMHERHYSPRTPLLLVDCAEALPDRRGAYIWRKKAGLTSRSLRMPTDAASYAARLYSVLHQLDEEGWPWIGVENPPNKPEWAGIRDRLQRASTRLRIG